MKEDRQDVLKALVSLSHELGRADLGMAILGEGNTSARIKPNRFFVKASGSKLSSLRAMDLVECRSDILLRLMDDSTHSDAEVEAALMKSRVNPRSKKPSVEALFHAYLLSLKGVNFVGHSHAVAVNQLLCSPRARMFAEKRIFPDEVVCCGARSVYVPYTDPGFSLAKQIRSSTADLMTYHKTPPRVILVQNHGIITLGSTPEAVLAAMLMAEKAARIWIGAATLGGPVFLSQSDVDRIAGRADELYRQRALKL